MEAVVRWLLTYLLHSTVLLGFAALARIALRERRLVLQEALLRAALVGGFVTAGLQVGLDVQPLGGSLALQRLAGLGRHAAAAPAGETSPAPAWGHPTFAVVSAPLRPSGLPAEASPARVESAAPVLAASGWVPAVLRGARAALPSALALAWAVLATVALARLAVAAVRLRRLLHGRRAIDAGALGPLAAGLARSLGLRRPVRLSAAERLSVPLATGVVRPEVCLPERAVTELGADEQAALCAHELAHLARRDPAWLLLARVAEALAPVQPLNAWARRRLQDVAECLSDDLGVAASGRPLGLARSLVDVASWTVGDRSVLPAAALGAVSSRSRLGHRVERLMDPARPLERPRRVLLPIAAVVVLATALVTPVVSGSATPHEPQPAAAALQSAGEKPGHAPEARPERPPEPDAGPAPEPPAAAPPDEPEPPEPPAPPRAKTAPPRAPKPAPAPDPRPAPPAPKARPAPEPRPAPEASERLEELTRRIGERARLNEPEMKKLEAEIEAAVAKLQIEPAEMKRLSADMERAARELADSVSVDVGREGGEGGRKSDRTAEAARRMAELEKEMREVTRSIRIPEEEVRALAEKARALAERARPTPDELRELHELAAGQARIAAEEGRRVDEQVREAMRAAREALEQAREALRQAEPRH